MSALERYTPPQRLDEIERLASHFAESGLFGNSSKTQSEMVVKMLAGAENGFGPFASVQGIHVIQGKPEMGADLLARSVKQSGRYNYRVRELNDNTCRIEFFEGDESIGISRFTVEDAKRAGISNAMYGKYPRNMLFARAMSNGVSWYCPDATSTRFYVDGEISNTPAPSETVIHEVTVEPDERYQRTEETASAGHPDADKSRGSDSAFHDAKPHPVSTDSSESYPEQPVEPERIVADQLAAIGAEGRKRIKAFFINQGKVDKGEKRPEAWIDAIVTEWSEGDPPPYTNLAGCLAAIDRAFPSSTPVTRRDEEDAKYDAEADALFQASNPDVRSLPMYGEKAPS